MTEHTGMISLRTLIITVIENESFNVQKNFKLITAQSANLFIFNKIRKVILLNFMVSVFCFFVIINDIKICIFLHT